MASTDAGVDFRFANLRPSRQKVPLVAHLPLNPDGALSLALAVIESAASPILLVDADLRIIAASKSFCSAFGVIPIAAPGCRIFDLAGGAWDVPQLHSLLAATLSDYVAPDAYEMDLVSPGRAPRRLVLNAKKLDYADTENVRLLVSVWDITDARDMERRRDEVVREKAVLLQELQHRIANSLQIIASVLLQSARRVRSVETREHLYDAHNRVMSVASMQQQLSATREGNVEIRSYLTDLIRSIGASMIRDPNQITIAVFADRTVTDASSSMGIGLIVTELVINALKHGFPSHRKGEIKVDFRTSGAGWTLRVSDNGVGKPEDPASAKSGLGTSIIQALARNLNAVVEITDGNPGMMVTVVHPGSRPGSRS